MYDSVLVPTDGSEGTDIVLDHALDLAGRHGAAVHALYVIDQRQLLGAPEDVAADVRDELEERGEEAVDAVASRAADEGLQTITTIVEGVPYRAITEYVDEEAIDIVVMGTHGRTGRDRLATLGSVTERVVKHATVPVFVVTIGR